MKENLPTRKKVRLKEYDYSNCGMYFITICIKNRKEIFGTIQGNKICLTETGKIAEEHIYNLEEIFDNIEIDEYVVMPNHIHMIINIKIQKAVKIPGIIKKLLLKK